MARAHLFRPATDQQGNLLYNATVTVNETNYAVPIGQALYSDSMSTATLSNPFVIPNGVIDFWLDIPQRVSIQVQAEGVDDILVYLDAPVPPEQTVSTTSPMEIVNTPSTSGEVLLSTGTPNQFQWGAPPTGTGLTPIVVASSQSFNTGSDPTGWAVTTGSATMRSYDAATIPPGTNYYYSLHSQGIANGGVFTLTGPSFTLLEAGTLSLWVKTSFSQTENLTMAVTLPGPSTTTLGTISQTRDWGFYSYVLAPGTYTPVFTYTGPSTGWAAGAHDVWIAGYVAQYGGNVPPHTHAGTGTNSVALGTSATASGNYATAVGASTTASGVDSTAYGYTAQATGNSALAIGYNAMAVADYSLAVGANATGTNTATAWTAVGYNANASGQEAVAIGKAAASTASYAIAVGSSAAASGSSSVAIGQNSVAQGNSGVALGQGATVGSTHTNSVALGSGATTTGANQIMLGNPGAMTIIPGSLQNYGLVSLGMAGSRVGFYGATGATQQIVGGSDNGNQTLRGLVQALANMGLIVNQSLQQPAAFATPVGIVDYFYRQDAGNGTLGTSDFDYAPYTYAPLAYSATGPYPSGPQWFVGTDHNGYKGVASGLGALKNTYQSNQGVEFAAYIQAATTGNKICIAIRHSGQTDGTAGAVYLILDQTAGTISVGVSPAGSTLTTSYTVASGNSVTLSSLGLTPFDGGIHKHRVWISGQTVAYVDGNSPLLKPVYFYDPAIPTVGTYTGADFATTSTGLNSVTFLPLASFSQFRTTGALTNLASGEAWQTAVSGSGAGATVSSVNNLQLTGASSGYALAYYFTNSNTTSKSCHTTFTGTISSTSGIIGRLQDANNYYLITPTLVTKVVAGTQSTLATHSASFASGDTMKVTFDGTVGTISVFKNGTQVASVVDTTFISQTRFGLGQRGTGTANFPYLHVTDAYNQAVIYK